MVKVGFDLIAIGGMNRWPMDWTFPTSDLIKLSCVNDILQWTKLPQKLKTPRSYHLAIPVPDDFIECV